MKSNGWVVDTSSYFPRWQKVWNDMACNSHTFYGFKPGWQVGRIRAVFKGNGKAHLDFGNCAKQGVTKVFLNNYKIGIAGPRTRSKLVSFSYTKGSTLRIEEHGLGIIKLNRLFLESDKGEFNLAWQSLN